jgi:hypothetical protein
VLIGGEGVIQPAGPGRQNRHGHQEQSAKISHGRQFISGVHKKLLPIV